MAFVGAGVFNLVGLRATQDDFCRWGYPRWWSRITGILEIVDATLIAVPAVRAAGLMLGASIIVAAAAAVLPRREFAHAVPVGVFALLLAAAAATS